MIIIIILRFWAFSAERLLELSGFIFFFLFFCFYAKRWFSARHFLYVCHPVQQETRCRSWVFSLLTPVEEGVPGCTLWLTLMARGHWSKSCPRFSQAADLLNILTLKWCFSDEPIGTKVVLFERHSLSLQTAVCWCVLLHRCHEVSAFHSVNHDIFS